MSSILKPLIRGPKNNKFHYEPRYEKKETNLESRKSKIKLERGSFYKHSKTLSKYKDASITHYKHNTVSRKYSKYIISLAMMASIYVYYTQGGFAGFFAIGAFLILLIIFIRLNNKR